MIKKNHLHVRTRKQTTITLFMEKTIWTAERMLYYCTNKTPQHTHTKMAPVEGSNMQWVGEEPMQGRFKQRTNKEKWDAHKQARSAVFPSNIQCQHSRHNDMRWYGLGRACSVIWKLLDSPSLPHQSKFHTEGLLVWGWIALVRVYLGRGENN